MRFYVSWCRHSMAALCLRPFPALLFVPVARCFQEHIAAESLLNSSRPPQTASQRKQNVCASQVTVQDQQAWKVPPCVSNWKNARGYTIPLDKRLAADGRCVQDVFTFVVIFTPTYRTVQYTLHVRLPSLSFMLLAVVSSLV